MNRLRLVKECPDKVGMHTVLTDGRDSYKVDDRHYRNGFLWFHLYNVASPERNDWFRLADMGELFFTKDPLARNPRRYGTIRKG